VAFLLSACSPKHEEKIWLWVWERNEDLRWLNESEFGVAYLARSLEVGNNMYLTRPRQQPLKVPEGIDKLPVIRIETRDEKIWNVLPELADAIVHSFPADLGRLQIDFDAKVSERFWYAELIKAIKTKRPNLQLSITALASWVMSDPWIDTLPIEEAVPMFFDMGVDTRNISAMLMHGNPVRSKKAQRVYGLALDEEIPVDIRGSRVYFFSDRNWNKRDLELALKHYDLE
jgi:hypothetical protein